MTQQVESVSKAATELLARAQSEPQAVIDLTVDRPTADRSPDDCVAMRANAIAHRILGRNHEALAAITIAREIAGELGDNELEATCLLSNAPLLAQSGDVAGAFRLLDRAEAAGGQLHVAEVEFQRAGVALLIADWRRSQQHYTAALDVFRSENQRAWQAEALLGRGLMAAYLGDHDQAQVDLAESGELFTEVDDVIGVGQVAWNSALATLMRGDPATAVAGFDRAGRMLDEAGFPIDLFLGDQSEALFGVGLHEEAVALAIRCVEAYEIEADHTEGEAKTRNVLDAASRRLELARALALTGDLDAARRHVSLAASQFQEQNQHLRQLHAHLVLLDIEQRSGAKPRVICPAAERIFEELNVGGQGEWRIEALLIQARCLVADGADDEARLALHRVGRRFRSFVQELDRLRLFCEIEQGSGRYGSALRFARRAMRVVSDAPRLGGSSFIEAAVSRQVEDVVDIGLSVLLNSGRARAALDFVEASELSLSKLQSPQETSALLSEHRALSRAIEEAINDLRDPSPIVKRRERLAHQIRAERTQLSTQKSGVTTLAATSAPALRWVAAGGDLWVIERQSGKCSSRRLGQLAPVVELVEELTFLLRRLLFSETSTGAALGELAIELDEALGHPGKNFATTELLHLVPASHLPSVPYGLLPSLHEVNWARVSASQITPRSDAAGRNVGLVAGPGLKHADREAELLAANYPQATTLTASDATIDAVLRSFEGAHLVHIAAHSSLKSANPMFSSIELFDGPLYLHELEGLIQPPETVVLASCESALEGRVGTSSVGLASGLLRTGIDVVIGTAVVIPDCAETTATMCRLHGHLSESDAISATHQTAAARDVPAKEQLIAASLVPCIASL